MFISNLFGIDNTCSFGEEISLYLATHGCPILSFTEDKFVFRNTKLLKKVLKEMPNELKIKLDGGGSI